MKDIFDTYDMPTEYGSRVYAGHQPAADAAGHAKQIRFLVSRGFAPEVVRRMQPTAPLFTLMAAGLGVGILVTPLVASVTAFLLVNRGDSAEAAPVALDVGVAVVVEHQVDLTDASEDLVDLDPDHLL